MGAWARRFRAGEVTLRGHAAGAVEVGEGQLSLHGPVRVAVAFRTLRGARNAEVTQLRVEGALALDGAPSLHWAAAAGNGLPLDRVLEDVVGFMADVEIEARAWADGEVSLAFGGGLEVSIPGEQQLTVRGATAGPAGALRLSAPLVVCVQGAAIRLGPEQFRWLSSLARVRVDRATLHPDGSVHLEGGARAGLDRAVRGGLHQASVSLSRLVRSSPRFARVRAFLGPS